MKMYQIFTPSGDVRTVYAEDIVIGSDAISFFVGRVQIAQFYIQRICGWHEIEKAVVMI